MTKSKIQIFNKSIKSRSFIRYIVFRFGIIFVIWYLIFILPASAELAIGGYYKNDLMGLFKRDGEGIIADVNRLRFRIDYGIIDNAALHLEPQYAVLVKSKEIPVIDTSTLDKLVFDRSYLKLNFIKADIVAGKQRVAWGTGHIWNPTDVFNPFALSFAVAEEERAGVEAVRVQVPFDAASVFDAVVLTDNRDISQTRKGLKIKHNIGIYDISLSYTAFGETDHQIGFDTAGELWGWGVRSEIAFISLTSEADRTKMIFGCDYTFENGWGVDLEYFYNGAGSSNIADYDWSSLLSGSIYQLAKNYLFVGFNNAIDEITSVSVSFILNADDGSSIFYPSYERNIIENIDLNIAAMMTSGAAGTEYKPSSSEDTTGFLGSNICFAKIRYSF